MKARYGLAIVPLSGPYMDTVVPEDIIRDIAKDRFFWTAINIDRGSVPMPESDVIEILQRDLQTLLAKASVETLSKKNIKIFLDGTTNNGG